MKIRKFRGEDRAEIVALLSNVLPDDQPHNEPNLVIDQKLAVDDLMFVAEEEDGSLVGFIIAGWDGHRGWLYSLAVWAAVRRQGIGRELVEHALDALRGLGCRKVNLQIRGNNDEVVAFYESLGFMVEDRISMGIVL